MYHLKLLRERSSVERSMLAVTFAEVVHLSVLQRGRARPRLTSDPLGGEAASSRRILNNILHGEAAADSRDLTASVRHISNRSGHLFVAHVRVAGRGGATHLAHHLVLGHVVLRHGTHHGLELHGGLAVVLHTHGRHGCHWWESHAHVVAA